MGIGRVDRSARVYCKHGINSYVNFTSFLLEIQLPPVFHFFEKVHKGQLKIVNINH